MLWWPMPIWIVLASAHAANEMTAAVASRSFEQLIPNPLVSSLDLFSVPRGRSASVMPTLASWAVVISVCFCMYFRHLGGLTGSARNGHCSIYQQALLL